MKNMTKSMKIALVSAISFVCVLAISLGCIFGLRKENNGTPPETVLTWSQKVDLLGEELTASNKNKNNFEIINNTISYDNYYDKDTEILTHVGQGYFVLENISSSEKSVYFCKQDSSGVTEAYSVTNTKENGGFAESENGTCKVVDFNDKYLVLQYSSEHIAEETMKVVYTVVDLKTQKTVGEYVFDNFDPVTYFNGFKFSESGNSAVMMHTKPVYAEPVVEDVVDDEVGSEDSGDQGEGEVIEEYPERIADNNTIYFFDFVSGKLHQLHSFEKSCEYNNSEDKNAEYIAPEDEFYLSYFENSVVFAQNGEAKIFIISDGKVYSSEIELQEGMKMYSSYQIFSNKVVVELIEEVKNGTDLTGRPILDIFYTYKVLTLSNDKVIQSNFNLKEGQAQFEFVTVGKTFFATRAYGKNADGSIDSTEFVLSYYYQDNSLIFEIESDRYNEEILNAKSGKILTRTALYDCDSSTEFEKICEFNENNTLFNNNKSNDTFYVATYSQDNKTYSVKYFDLSLDTILTDLELVYGEGEDKKAILPMEDYFDGTNTIFKSEDGYFRFNKENHTLTKIERFYDGDEKFNVLLSNGLKVYLETNDDLSFKLNHLSGETILDNISAYNFVRDIKNGLLLNIISNGETKTIYLDVDFDLVSLNDAAEKNADVEPYSNEVTPYKSNLTITYHHKYTSSGDVTKVYTYYKEWFAGQPKRDISIMYYQGGDQGYSFSTFQYWCNDDEGTYKSYSAGQSWTEAAYGEYHWQLYAVVSRNITIYSKSGASTYRTYTWTQYMNVWWHYTVSSTAQSNYNNVAVEGWAHAGFGYNAGSTIANIYWGTSSNICAPYEKNASISRVVSRSMTRRYNYNGSNSDASTTIYCGYNGSNRFYSNITVAGSSVFSRTGYTYNSWLYKTTTMSSYCSSSNAIAVNTSWKHPYYTDTSNSSIIYFTPNWVANTYYIQLNANGGSLNNPKKGSGTTVYNSSSFIFKATYDTDATFKVDVSRTGYIFKCWGRTSTATVSRYDIGSYIYNPTNSTTDWDTATATADNLTSTNGATVTIYAVWTPITYYISLDTNDGSDNDGSITSHANVSGTTVSGTTITATYNTTAKFSASVKRPGYKFAGWVTSSGTAVSGISDTSYTTINDTTQYRSVTTTGLNLTSTRYATITLYAKWTPITFTTKFDANGGAFENSSQVSTTYGASDITKKIYKKGYLFSGWTLSGSGASASSISGSYSNPDETMSYTTVNTTTKLCYTHGSEVTLKAVWTALTITIQLDANGGTISESKYSDGTDASSNTFYFSYNTTNTFTNNIVKEGYRFDGWVIKNATNNGGIAHINTNDQSSNKATYVLVDQSTTVIGITTQTRNITTNKTTVKFEAKWTPITYYIQYLKNKPAKASETVMLGSSTTELIPNTTVNYDETKAITSSYYTLKGWTQIGWSTSASADSADYTIGQSHKHTLTTIHSSTVKYYAVWQQNKYKVTLDPYGENAEISNFTEITTETIHDPDLSGAKKVFYLKYDDNATFAINIVRPGYMFAGWTLESSSNDTGVVNPKAPGTYANFSSYYDANRETTDSITVTTDILNVNSTAGGASTLKAKWTAITYYVELNKNASDSTINYPNDTAISGLTFTSKYTIRYDVTGKFKVNIYRVGYQFIGWLSSNGNVGTIGCYDSNDTNAFVPNNDTTQTNTLVTRITNLTTCQLSTVTLSINWREIAYYIKLVAAPDDANVTFTNHNFQNYSELVAPDYDPNPPAASAFDYVVHYDRNSTFTVDLKRPGYKFTDWKITTGLGDYSIRPSDASYASILSYYSSNPETADLFNLLTMVHNLTTTAYQIVTLTAQWTPINYTISYLAHKPNKNETLIDSTYPVEGFVPNSSERYDVKSKLQTNNYTLIGWTYIGWSEDKYLINPTDAQIARYIFSSGQEGIYNLTTKDNANVKLYAIWRQNEYYLNYDLDNVNSYTNKKEEQVTGQVHTTIFKFDDPFREISIPTKVGYTFDRFEITGMSNNNTKFWSTSNTASYTGNGTIVGEDVTTLRLENPASNKSNPNAHPNGNKDTPSTTTTIQDFFVKNLSSIDKSTVYIKAYWSKNIYNITYNYSSGSPDPRGLYPAYSNYDEEFNVTHPIRFGYTFTGWNITGMGWSGTGNCTHTTICTHILGTTPTTSDTAEGITATSFKNLNCHHDATVTMTATWRPNEYYIRYVLDDAKGEYKVSGRNYPELLKFDEWSNIDNPAKMGYTFTGWIISGMSLTCDHLYNVAGTTTGAFVTALDRISIEDISIDYFLNLHSEDKETVTFTPTWIPNIYKIQYVVSYTVPVNDKDVLIEGKLGSGIFPSTATYDEAFHVDAPGEAPFGYYFDGWIISGMNNNKIAELSNASCKHYYGTSEDNVKNNNTQNTTITLGKDYDTFMNLHSETGSTVTFKANWKPNVYNIEYIYSDRKGNDGHKDPNVAEVKSIAYNQKFSVGVPLRPGYTFVGWNLDFLSDECPHYYYTTTSNSSEVEFESYENGYYDIENNNPTIFVNVNAVAFMNLHCEMGATVVLTAKWLANDYKVTYHYMDYAMSSITESKLNAVGGNPEYYTENRTIEYKYDSIFKTLDVAKSANDTNGVMTPNNVTILYWLFFSKTVGSTGCTPSISYTSGKGYVLATMNAQKVVTPASGTYCLSPGTEYVFNSSKNFDIAELFGNNDEPNYVIHAYAVYGYVDVKVKLYGVGSGTTDILEYNNLASYIELTNSIPGKVGQEYIVPDTVNEQPIKGYMISTNLYNYGELTADSITSYVYDGVTYIAAAGEEIKWHLPTSAAQDPNNPTFYVYVVYDVVDKTQIGSTYSNENHYIQFNTGTKFEAGKQYTITIRGLDETSYFDYEYVQLAKTFNSSGTDRAFGKVYAHTGTKENCKGTVTTKVNASKDTLSITFTADSSTAEANLFLVFDGTITLNGTFVNEVLKNIDIVIIQNP